MQEQVLKEILEEVKGVRGESVITNQKLNGLTDRVDGLTARVDTLTTHVDGLHQSVVVLQQGVADVRYEVKAMKEILAEKVI